MGEVYRARDTRLDRAVAIKVLPAEFARDASLRLRFEREAKTISSISHPHICTLFDVGHHNGTDYIVMELLEGETLADRLARGALPMTDVLRIGAQIADALAAAHRHGIVHRDLKPGNIMLSRNGPKLLDFGLAKGAEAPVSDRPQSLLTAQKPITEEGAIVGTFQYMSPEQLEGLPADARTDIFALGTVLYEMATGARAFSGKTRTSLAAAIVAGQPRPMSDVQPMTPPAFERLVRACLEKVPDDRMQSAHDVAMELRWIASNDVVSRPARASRLGWAIAGLLALFAVAGAIYHVRTRPQAPQTLRFTVPPPAGTNIIFTAAIAPDAKRLVFRADALDGSSALWMRSLDSLATTRLHADSVTHVFWSPDSRHIGIVGRGVLRRLDTEDGSLKTLASGISAIAGGGTWGRGDIVYSALAEGALSRVSSDGAEPKAATQLHEGERLHLWPWFLPDGRHFIYTVLGVGDTSGLYVGSLDSDLRKRILRIGQLPDMTRAMYAAGRLLYVRNRSLYSQPFDVGALELRDTPVLIDEDLEFSGPLRTPLSAAADGTIIYRKAGSVTVDQLSLVDRSGRELATVGKPAPVNVVRFSRDGRSLLIAYDDPIGSVWIRDLDRDTERRVTEEMWAGLAAWIDDDSFVYSAVTDTPPNLYVKRADGSSSRLTNAPRQHYIQCVTADGRLAIYVTDAGGSRDVVAVPLQPPHTPIPLLTSAANEIEAEVSPDGKWLAYTSNASGAYQVYVTSFPKPGRTWPVSAGRGVTPRWSRDGRELYYYDSGSDTLMAARLEGPELRPGRARPLFKMPSSQYDVGSDGNFVIAKPQLNPDSPHLTVLMNWR